MAETKDDVFEAVCTLLDRYNPEGLELGADTDLNAELNIDSVAAMDLVMEVEDKFEIDIPINLVADVTKLGDLVDVVRKQLEAK